VNNKLERKQVTAKLKYNYRSSLEGLWGQRHSQPTFKLNALNPQVRNLSAPATFNGIVIWWTGINVSEKQNNPSFHLQDYSVIIEATICKQYYKSPKNILPIYDNVL
jgi:hypothetical protein